MLIEAQKVQNNLKVYNINRTVSTELLGYRWTLPQPWTTRNKQAPH